MMQTNTFSVDGLPLGIHEVSGAFHLGAPHSLVVDVRPKQYTFGLKGHGRHKVEPFTFRVFVGAQVIFNGMSEVFKFSKPIAWGVESIPSTYFPPSSKVAIEFDDHPNRVVTKFLREVHGAESLTPGVYSATPINTSFGVDFKLRVTETSIAWIVSRSPPIPSFLASVFVDGKLMARTAVEKVPPEGIEFDNVIDLVQYRKHHIGASNGSISFTAEFFEDFRSHHDVIAVEDVAAFRKELVEKGKVAAYSRDSEAVDSVTFETTGESQSVGFSVQRKRVLGRLLLLIKCGGESIKALEAEHVTLRRNAFGWWNAVTMKQLTQCNATFHMSFHFNDPSSSGMADVEALSRWVGHHGGSLANFVSFKNTSVAMHPIAMSTTRRVKRGELAFSLPISVLLSSAHLKTIGRLQELLGLLEKRHVAPGDVFVLALASYFDSDAGLRWSILFDSLPDTMADALPLSWSQEVKQSLAPATSFLRLELDAQEKKLEEDYAVLQSLGSNVREMVSFQSFRRRMLLIRRALLETHESEAFIAPFTIFLKPDDEPSVRIEFNNVTKHLEGRVVKEVSRGEMLSVAFEAERKTQVECFIHYGVLSAHSSPAAAVSTSRGVTLLTPNSRTSETLLSKDDLEAALAVLPRNVKLPNGVSAPDAKRWEALGSVIMRGERSVIEKHLDIVDGVYGLSDL